MSPDSGTPALPSDWVTLNWFIVAVAVATWDPSIGYARWTVHDVPPIIDAWSTWRGRRGGGSWRACRCGELVIVMNNGIVSKYRYLLLIIDIFVMTSCCV